MTQVHNTHAGHGMVVLNIGGHIEALEVCTPAHTVGVQTTIAPTGSRHDVPHGGGNGWDGQWRCDGHRAGKPSAPVW